MIDSQASTTFSVPPTLIAKTSSDLTPNLQLQNGSPVDVFAGCLGISTYVTPDIFNLVIDTYLSDVPVKYPDF
jgi:hypothetical protein